MNRLALLNQLTGALGLQAGSAKRSDLGIWIDAYADLLIARARDLITPPFAKAEFDAMAEVAVAAADKLKGIFEGQSRASIAQTVFVEAARAALPDGYIEEAAIWLLDSDQVAKAIESAYNRVLGPKAKKEAPTLPDLPATATDTTLPEPTVTPDADEGGKP